MGRLSARSTVDQYPLKRLPAEHMSVTRRRSALRAAAVRRSGSEVRIIRSPAAVARKAMANNASNVCFPAVT